MGLQGHINITPFDPQAGPTGKKAEIYVASGGKHFIVQSNDIAFTEQVDGTHYMRRMPSINEMELTKVGSDGLDYLLFRYAAEKPFITHFGIIERLVDEAGIVTFPASNFEMFVWFANNITE